MKTVIISMTPKKDPNDTDIDIITKALTNILWSTLGEMMSIEWSSAVPNRTIYNNLFTMRDVIEYSNKKNIIHIY